MSLRMTRLSRELKALKASPPEGIHIDWDTQDSLSLLFCTVDGPLGTRFENTLLPLQIQLAESYPLEPPVVHFTGAVRHPNVDEATGRICLDLLKMPPDGSWRPNVSLSSLLVSIQALLSAPNLDDPIRPDLVSEWTNKQSTRAETEHESCSSNRATAIPSHPPSSSSTKRPLSLSLSSRKRPAEG